MCSQGCEQYIGCACPSACQVPATVQGYTMPAASIAWRWELQRWSSKPKFGVFHGHGGIPKCLVHNGKSHLEIDDGYPHFRKPPNVNSWSSIVYLCLLQQRRQNDLPLACVASGYAHKSQDVAEFPAEKDIEKRGCQHMDTLFPPKNRAGLLAEAGFPVFRMPTQQPQAQLWCEGKRLPLSWILPVNLQIGKRRQYIPTYTHKNCNKPGSLNLSLQT